MKKSIKTLVFSILILAILGGGYFFAVKWQPEKEKDEEAPFSLPDVEVLMDLKLEDVASATINTGKTEYTIINSEPVSIEGYSSLLTNSSSIESILHDITYISGSHKIENVGERLNEYGLDTKEKFVTVKLKDGTSHTLIAGNKANYEDNYFAMMEGTDTVYVVASYNLDAIFKEPSSLRKTDICTFDTETLKELTVSRGSEKILSLKRKEKKPSEKDENSIYNMAVFNITYPYSNLVASADRLTELFEKFTSLTATEITEENPSDLSKYGLSSPVVVTLTEENATHRIKLGKKIEGNKVYLMYNDVNVVYTAQCEFYDAVTNIDASEYLEKFIHLFNIASVESIRLKIDNKESELGIKGYDGEKGEGTFLVNGKKTDEKTFKNIYQSIIGLRLSSVASKEPSGEEKCTITFNMKDKTSKTFTYYKYDERHSIVKSDAGINCLVLTKTIDSISKLIS